ncbi:MAG: hypothetical protein R3D46_10135 [Defluviimonas denitrificans]
MGRIIDASQTLTPHVEALLQGGVHDRGPLLQPAQRAGAPNEMPDRGRGAGALAAGLSLAVVFQQNGGHGGTLSDLTEKTGARDGTRARELAERMDQPVGSAITSFGRPRFHPRRGGSLHHRLPVR